MSVLEGPVAVTGARGRLGRALVAELGPERALAWGRPDYDLDDPLTAVVLAQRDRPSLVIHAAAFTNVDACAREPELAMRRNAEAVEALARACRAVRSGLALVSTNEVFDGDRTDGPGYVETDATAPRNAYGRSKLAGEDAARSCYEGAAGLWVVRTAWLFGPPGGDFPDKIVAAADRLPADEALPVVADEVGSPTYTVNLARAVVELVGRSDGGLFHLVNAGQASRLEWAERVLAVRRPGRAVRPISRSEFVRVSEPPPWGVLDGSRAQREAGVRLRGWAEALGITLGAQAGSPREEGSPLGECV